jgi:hypothetical protein
MRRRIKVKGLEQVLISRGNCLECHISLQKADYPNHNNEGLSVCPAADTAHICVTALVHSKIKCLLWGNTEIYLLLSKNRVLSGNGG